MEGDSVMTGIYVPLGTETRPGQRIPGQVWCHGTMYRANPDGSGIERVAWGLRSNYGYRFAPDGRLIATQNSGNPIEPRPIYDDFEPVYEVVEGAWYGWPDFFSSLPVTDARFSRPDDPDFKKEPMQHRFVLTEETHRRLLKGRDRPRDPLVRLSVHSSAEGFVFGRTDFGLSEEEILVAEFGTIVPYMHDDAPGFRVQRANLSTGAVTDFLVNKSGKPASYDDNGGLERPIQLEWGPDGALYVVDFGVILYDGEEMRASPNTGVIWRLTRTGM
jgi:glucose/arabinose dehydrogenase